MLLLPAGEQLPKDAKVILALTAQVTLFEMTATEQIEALNDERIDIAFSRLLPSAISNEFITARFISIS